MKKIIIDISNCGSLAINKIDILNSKRENSYLVKSAPALEMIDIYDFEILLDMIKAMDESEPVKIKYFNVDISYGSKSNIIYQQCALIMFECEKGAFSGTKKKVFSFDSIHKNKAKIYSGLNFPLNSKTKIILEYIAPETTLRISIGYK
jgi:hypothetical protein